MPEIAALTATSFREFIRANNSVLVHFWACWNSYDGEQRKIIEAEIPESIASRIAFASLNVDLPENHTICAELKILNLPFLAFYRDDALVHRRTGVLRGDQLLELLQEYLV